MNVQASRLADSSVKDFAKFRALQKQGKILQTDPIDFGPKFRLRIFE